MDPARICLVLAGIVAILLAISLPLQFLVYGIGIEVPVRIVAAFDFDRENNLPTWLSTMMLGLCAVVLFLVYRAGAAENDPQAKWWAGLALVFLYLSIDEAASLHEASVERLQLLLGTTGALYAAWVIPAGLVLVIFGLVYLRFFLSLPRALQGWLVLAAALFVGGAIGLELVAWAHRYPLHAADPTDWEASKDIVWALLSHLEEVLEKAGTIVFLYALLSYLAQRRIGVSITIAEGARSRVAERT